MRTKTRSFQIDPNPDLPQFLKEIVSRLCDGDWERWSTPGGEFVYFVIGAQAQKMDKDRVVEFDPMFPFPSEVSQLSRWFVRAQIAAEQPDATRAARSRLNELGVSDEMIQDLIELRTESFKELRIGERPELLRAFADFLTAAVVARGIDADRLEPDERRRIARDMQKIYLKEIVKKYTVIMRRVGKLEALRFSDPQLEEASRCYLYGFHRAAVVLSAAAVETHLKRITGKERFEQYAELTEAAVWGGKLDGSHRDAATRVFKVRHQVVHHGHRPDVNETEEILALARDVLDVLRS